MDLKRKQQIWHLAALGICIAVSLWLGTERWQALQSGSLHPATVLDCDGEWFKRGQGSNRTSRDVLQYAPVAYTEDGHRARGYAWLDESVCLRTLGNAVSVLVHPNDRKLNRIVTFGHFWLLPAIASLLTVVLLLGLLPAPRGAPLVAFLLGVGVGGGALWLELNPTQDTRGLNASERALAQCAQQAVFDEQVADRTVIRKLICQNPAVDDLTPLAGMPQLEELYLQGASLTSLLGIEALPALRRLSVANNKRLHDLAGIEHAQALLELQANGAGLQTLKGLEHLSALETLAVMRNQLQGPALEPLRGLARLESVVVNNNRITDLSPLTNKPALRELQIYGNDITDVRPLYGNKALEIVGIRGRGNVSCSEIEALRAVLNAKTRVFGQASCDPPK